MTSRMVDERVLLTRMEGSDFWDSYLRSAMARRKVRIHLAVFVEPYLSYVLDGSKTVESRFTRRPTAPYGRVGPGDVVLLKRSGGKIEAICRAAEVWFYELQPHSWREIRQHFGRAMRLSPTFLRSRSEAAFATLIRIDEVRRIAPIPAQKRDRRGWVVLYDPQSSGLVRHGFQLVLGL